MSGPVVREPERVALDRLRRRYEALLEALPAEVDPSAARALAAISLFHLPAREQDALADACWGLVVGAQRPDEDPAGRRSRPGDRERRPGALRLLTKGSRK